MGQPRASGRVHGGHIQPGTVARGQGQDHGPALGPRQVVGHPLAQSATQPGQRRLGPRGPDRLFPARWPGAPEHALPLPVPAVIPQPRIAEAAYRHHPGHGPHPLARQRHRVGVADEPGHLAGQRYAPRPRVGRHLIDNHPQPVPRTRLGPVHRAFQNHGLARRHPARHPIRKPRRALGRIGEPEDRAQDHGQHRHPALPPAQHALDNKKQQQRRPPGHRKPDRPNTDRERQHIGLPRQQPRQRFVICPTDVLHPPTVIRNQKIEKEKRGTSGGRGKGEKPL
jgi:hypothetical protein